MSEPLKISIVTPSYNQARFLGDCLLSVKEQSYPAAEHIVVDGGSTDGSVEILRGCSSKPGWSHLRWTSEADRGQTDAINKGLRLASGDILAYLNSDDAYALGAFHFVNSFFMKNPEVDLIYGECWFTSENGDIVRRKKALPFSRGRLLRADYILQPTVFMRARAWRKVGQFNESLHHAMDYEYWLRAARCCTIVSVNEHLANYRWHRESKTVSDGRGQMKEGYDVACSFGGGGVYSWYLHMLYWPNTAAIKRWVFPRLNTLRTHLGLGLG